jgi:hypothetical protein
MPERSIDAEATSFRELFGSDAAAAVTRRVDRAIEQGDVDDALFWLAVRSAVEGTPPKPSMRIA